MATSLAKRTHRTGWLWALGLFAGCSDEALIPEAVLNSPPARRATPTDEYYQDPTRSKALDNERPLVSLAVDRSYDSWTLPQTAAHSLASLGPAALPVLVPQLSAPEIAQRRQAAAILARIGPDAAQTEDLAALTAIVERIEDAQEDVLVRRGCARALGQIGPALALARPPSPPAIAPPLEALPPANAAQLADPIAARARQREQARRDFDLERTARAAERYRVRLQNYQLRQELAHRAADALLRIAEQDATASLASARP